MLSPRVVLSALLDLSVRVAPAGKLEDKLKLVIDAVLGLLPANHGSIRVYDETFTELVCMARAGQGAERPAKPFLAGEGVLGWVVLHGRSAHVRDVSTDERFKTVGQQGFSIRSLLAVPLQSRIGVLGVLAVTAERTNAFSAEDEVLLSLLGNWVASIIELSRLETLVTVDVVTRAGNTWQAQAWLNEEIARAERSNEPLSVVALKACGWGGEGEALDFTVAGRFFKELTGLLLGFLRPFDHLARLAPARFLTILPCTDGAEAADRAKAMQYGLKEWAAKTTNPEGSSLGIIVATATWNGSEGGGALLRRAEQTLAQTPPLCQHDAG